MIQYALTEAQLDPTKEAIIMVGDRNHDILGAQQNGLDSIGVLYGFGEETELQEAGATFLVHSPKDLGAILLRNFNRKWIFDKFRRILRFIIVSIEKRHHRL